MSDTPLLRSRRFLPLFLVQSFGAFADNALKSAFTILVTYQGLSLFGLAPATAVLLGAAVYILPFPLLSGLAGELADKRDKAKIIRTARLAEIGLALAAGAALLLESTPLGLACILAYGAQSAVFSPAKYAILPELVGRERLINANALFEASVFVAILAGLLFGGLLAGWGETDVIAIALVAVAVVGYGVSRLIPSVEPRGDAVPLRLAPLRAATRALTAVAADSGILRAVLGISWFWGVGLVVITIFPEIGQSLLKVSADVANILLAAFVVGIALGTFLTSRLLKGEISARHVPLGALGMAVFLIDLGFATSHYASLNLEAAGIGAFLQSPAGLRICLDMIAIAAAGGIFTVPLYAIVQSRSDDAVRSRTIAGSNIVNAIVMVAATALATGLLAAGVDLSTLLVLFGLGCICVALYALKLVPDQILKALGRSLLERLFKARVVNIAAYGDGTSPAVVVANHTSYLDAMLLGCLLPGKPVFAVNTNVAKTWWMRPAFLFFDLVTIDPTNPQSIRTMVKLVQSGRRLVIFPEGRLSVTGGLMKIYDGPAMIAAHSGAPVIPIRIDGAQYSKLAPLKAKLPSRFLPEITLTVLPSRTIEIPDGLTGGARRAHAAEQLRAIMTRMMFETSPVDRTLFEALIDAGELNGRRAVIEDIEQKPIGYRRIMTGAFALGAKLAALTAPRERVGLMLPNAAGAAVAFFACQATGRVPAMLNYTAGAAGIAAAVKAAELKTVVTSRRFVALGKLEHLIEALSGKVRLVYLEDVRDSIGRGAKLAALLKALLPRLGLRLAGGHGLSADDEAVVLFTSGSEGAPKGVALSHRNIQANRFQISSVIDFTNDDVVLNALPMFHSFGLTAGFLLPLLSGVKTVLYPSPLHYSAVPEVAYGTNATIMFGTDTFLTGYARTAHPYDFFSLRYVFAGAERVRPETRATWSEKFGVRILEGYGTTETAPVLAINTALGNRPGTVGRLLPAMEARLEPVPGVDEGGRLHVRGPNVMLGYLKVDNPGRIEPPAEGWHDTGDIVTIDEQGFVTIQGRAKRFAKIGGEMVSLAAAEALASELWPEALVAAVAMPHARKGEQIVLLTDQPEAQAQALSSHAKAKGLSELMVPKTVFSVDTVPLLGTGKVDFTGAARLATEMMGTA